MSTQLPSALDAEKTILGSIIIQNELLDEVAAQLKPQDFYSGLHNRVFAAMIDLRRGGSDIDAVTLSTVLQNLPNPPSVAELASLDYGVPGGLAIRSYVAQVREKAALRKIARLGAEMGRMACDGESSIGELSQFAENCMAKIVGDSGATGAAFRPFAEIADETVDALVRLRDGENINIATGLSSLDFLTRGGITPGDAWVIAALTGKGKSALAWQIMRSIAGRGIPVAAISREMSDIENYLRCISASGKINLYKVRPRMDAFTYQRSIEAAQDIAGLPIFLNSRTANIYELKPQIKALVKQQGVRVLFVDYLQLLSAGVGGDNRTREIEAISRTLKEIALDLNIGVVALAQFNRHGAYEGKPQLHHLDGSSQIEKDCSVGLIIDLGEQQEGSEMRDAVIRIAKQRNGQQAEIPYKYRGEFLTFYELTELEQAA